MDLVSVGKISGSHHLKGAVKVISNLDELEILIGKKVILELPSGGTKVLTVKRVENLFEKKWIFEFEELTNKTETMSIQGASIKVRRDILGIKEDEFLVDDIIGITVITEDAENIGEVVDIYQTPAHDIYVVQNEEYETMIPDVDVFIKKIDFDKREMIVSLIEGMREKKRS